LRSTLNSFPDYIVFASQSVARNEAGWDEWSRDRVTKGYEILARSLRDYVRVRRVSHLILPLYVYPFRHALQVTQRIGPHDLILFMHYEIAANCCFEFE